MAAPAALSRPGGKGSASCQATDTCRKAQGKGTHNRAAKAGLRTGLPRHSSGTLTRPDLHKNTQWPHSESEHPARKVWLAKGESAG